MSSRQRRASQLYKLSARKPFLDVPVDRDEHLCGFLGPGALRDGLAGATPADLTPLSHIHFMLAGAHVGSPPQHHSSPPAEYSWATSLHIAWPCRHGW